VVVWTIGHGTRRLPELTAVLADAGVATLVDVRRFPGSRRNPQFNRPALVAALAEAGIAYRHAVELGGRLSGEPGEDRFPCIRTPAFRSYAARMGTAGWQEALATALAEPAPCFMCAETSWRSCHRSLIAELLHARGDEVVHLIRPGEREPHVPARYAEAQNGHLHMCGEPVEGEGSADRIRLIQQRLFEGESRSK
jgi:uncharacterized protein (DUF488 family)